MRDDKILNRIRALLAKAESTTPEEAELLTAKAAELMLRHAISQAQVAADHTVAEGFKEIRFEFTGIYMRPLRRLFMRVANALGAFPLYWTRSKSQTVVVYAWESTAEHVEAILRSIELQAAMAREAWWREVRGMYAAHERTAARASYIDGYASGVVEQIRKGKEQIGREGTGGELVLVERQDRLAAQVKAQVGPLRSGRASRTYDSTAYASGADDGRKANIGRNELGVA